MSDFQQTNATPDDLRQWVMSFYAQDSFRIAKNFTLNFGIALGADVLPIPTNTGAATSFSLPAFLAGPAQHRASHRACRAVLPRRLRNSPRELERAARPTSRRASAWCGIRRATASETLRIGGAHPVRLHRNLVQRARNHQPALRQRYRRRRHRHAHQSVGRLSRAAIRFRSTGTCSSRSSAPTSTCRSIPSRPTSSSGTSPISASSPRTGWLRSATWATRPRICGSR